MSTEWLVGFARRINQEYGIHPTLRSEGRSETTWIEFKVHSIPVKLKIIEMFGLEAYTFNVNGVESDPEGIEHFNESLTDEIIEKLNGLITPIESKKSADYESLRAAFLRLIRLIENPPQDSATKQLIKELKQTLTNSP